MSIKAMVRQGILLGSTVGGVVPTFWGAEMIFSPVCSGVFSAACWASGSPTRLINEIEDMTNTISLQTEWERNPRTGNWHHPTHGEIERVGNRWRVTGTTKQFYLIGEAQQRAQERTQNRKPEQGNLFE